MSTSQPDVSQYRPTLCKGVRYANHADAMWAAFLEALPIPVTRKPEIMVAGMPALYRTDFYLPSLGLHLYVDAHPDANHSQARYLSRVAHLPVLHIVGKPGLETPKWALDANFDVEPNCATFEMVLFGGEGWETFDTTPPTLAHSPQTAAYRMETLREFLRARVLEDVYLHGSDLDFDLDGDLTSALLRQQMIALDRLYFVRHYGREHRNWLDGRCAEVEWDWQGGNLVLKFSGGKYQAPIQCPEILAGIRWAEQARETFVGAPADPHPRIADVN